MLATASDSQPGSHPSRSVGVTRPRSSFALWGLRDPGEVRWPTRLTSWGTRWAWVAALAVCLAAVVVLAVNEVGGELLPAWLEAVGTVGALAIGLVEVVRLGRREAETREREAENRSREEDRKLRAQSDAVGVWFDGVNKDQFGPRTARVAIVNASPLPVFDLTVHIGSGFDLTVFGPETVPPNSHQTCDTRAVVDVDEHGRVIAPGVRVEFRDAGGRWWRRSRDGVLTEIEWPFSHKVVAGMT